MAVYYLKERYMSRQLQQLLAECKTISIVKPRLELVGKRVPVLVLFNVFR